MTFDLKSSDDGCGSWVDRQNDGGVRRGRKEERKLTLGLACRIWTQTELLAEETEGNSVRNARWGCVLDASV